LKQDYFAALLLVWYWNSTTLQSLTHFEITKWQFSQCVQQFRRPVPQLSIRCSQRQVTLVNDVFLQ